MFCREKEDAKRDKEQRLKWREEEEERKKIESETAICCYFSNRFPVEQNHDENKEEEKEEEKEEDSDESDNSEKYDEERERFYEGVDEGLLKLCVIGLKDYLGKPEEERQTIRDKLLAPLPLRRLSEY